MGVFLPHAPLFVLVMAVVLVSLAPHARPVVLGLMLGGLLAVRTLPLPLPQVKAHDPTWPRTMLIRGEVEEVHSYPGGRMVLTVGQVSIVEANGETRPLGANIAWTWERPPSLVAPGSVFEAPLRLRPLRGRANFGMPSAEAAWQRRGVGFRAYSQGACPVRWLVGPENTRLRFISRILARCPETAQGMVLALVSGERLFLEPALAERMRQAGLAHSLALSGLHVGLLLVLGALLARGITRLWPPLVLWIARPRLALALGLPLAAGYLWLGGAAPSLMRAAAMAAGAGLLLWRARRAWPQDVLFMAAALLLVLNPGVALEPSAQLSFAAVVGILLAMPIARPAHRCLQRWGIPWPVRSLLGICGVTVAASLATLPLQLWWFGLPAVGVVWNMLWLPVLGAWVMPWAGLGVAASALPGAEAVARGAFGAVGMATDALHGLLRWAEGLGWLAGHAWPRPGWPGWLALSVLGAAMVVHGPRRLLLVGIAIALALVEGSGWVPRGVQLTVLDTGASQAVVLETPSGRRVLVDAGGGFSVSSYDVGRHVVVPALAYQRLPRLDTAIASHGDADHIGGLPAVLRLLRVGMVAHSGLHGPQEAAQVLETALDRWQGPRQSLRAGERLEIEPSIVLEVLHPPPAARGPADNAHSVVLRLSWEGHGLALLPGDVPAGVWRQLAAGGVPMEAAVLVVPHHGSRDALAPEAWARVAPQYAVAACGPWDRFGHPHPEVRAWLAHQGIPLWTTAQHGAVRFIWRAPGQAPEVDWARRSVSPLEEGMTTILPTDKNLRPAVAWIEEGRKEGKDVASLVREAGMRFNLTPLEECKLADIYAEHLGRCAGAEK